MAAKINARLRALAIEREASAIYHGYEAEATRRGIRVAHEAELVDKVRNRISERAHRLGWPRRNGKLHLFLAFGNWNWEAVLPGAFSGFAEVSCFEWRALGFREELPSWLEQRDRMNRDMLLAFHAANRRRPVDIVVGYLSGLTVSSQILAEMSSAGAIITNFCYDDKHSFPGPVVGHRHTSTAAIANAVDLNLTSDPKGIIKYAVHGGLAMFHPEAADPALHRPYDVPFEYDVSFIGAKYGWRAEFIGTLQRSGVNISCFGPGWPSGSIANEQMALIYSKSRINLGFGGVGHSRKLRNLKGRDFEVPMSGGLYLTQENDELSLVYDVGNEIMTYSNEADCALKIRQLLACPARAASIRTAGYARALEEHTYQARWTMAFQVLGALA